MNVFSAFDGISTGMYALQLQNIPVEQYYSSEIDPHTITVSKKNFGDKITYLGDIKEISAKDLPKIDLLLGGFPCQSFSQAGGQKGFNDVRGQLLFDLLRLKKELNPTYFLFENVKLTKETKKMIDDLIGVEGIVINSALVSAQNRLRTYWTNIPIQGLPEDRGIKLIDVLDEEPNEKLFIKSDRPIVNTPESKRKIGYIGSNSQGNRVYDINDKSATLCGEAGGLGAKTGLYLDKVVCGASRGRDYTGEGNKQYLELRKDDKTNTLTTVQKDNLIIRDKSKCVRSGGRGSFDRHEWDSVDKAHIRKLSVTECERLQTLPTGFTEGISDTQRYKALGNGWTAEVISWILSFIPRGE